MNERIERLKATCVFLKKVAKIAKEESPDDNGGQVYDAAACAYELVVKEHNNLVLMRKKIKDEMTVLKAIDDTPEEELPVVEMKVEKK